MSSEVSLLVAFGAGVGSFFTPCVFPLIPAYISYITGISVEELQVRQGWRVMIPTLLFVLGFSVVFVLLGASFSLLGGFVVRWRPQLQIFAGGVVILFGLHLMGLLPLPFLQRERRFEIEGGTTHLLGPLLMGGVFALGWSPCVGPILGAILAYAATGENVLKGIVLLSVYSAGMALPFILVSLLIGRFLKVFGRIAKRIRLITSISGGVIGALGVMMIIAGLRGAL